MSDKIWLIYQNINGSWVIRGEYGVGVYYFYTKNQAIRKYLRDKGVSR